MRRMLKIEVSRAFQNRVFYLILAFCGGLVAFHFFEYVLPSLPFLYERIDELQGGMPPSLYINNAFMGFSDSLAYQIFSWTLPILVVLPFAGTGFTERKKGFVKNVFLRTKKKNYYLAKYIAVFLNGGSIAVLPVLGSLWLSALFLPAIPPEPTSHLTAIGTNSMWGELFYSHPLAYIFAYLAIQFVFYGLISTIALSVSFLTETKFIVLLTPFLIYLSTSFLCGWLGELRYIPALFLDMTQMLPDIQFSIIAVEAGVLFLFTSVGFVWTGCRKEVF